MTDETVSDLAAAVVRDARKAHGWQTSDLAARCAEAGHPELTKAVIENIESGRRDSTTGRRRRDVTVDELRVLADVLGFSPVDVLDGLPRAMLRGVTLEQIEQAAEALQAFVALVKWRDESEATDAGDS